MSELKPNYGNFVLKGIVGGTQSDKFFTTGISNGNEWRRLNFSVKVNDNASVFVEMMGSKSDKVKFVDASDKKNKKESFVPWADRYKERKDKAEIFMAAKVGLQLDEKTNKNKVIGMTQFDAVKYISDNLKDGDSVYIRGSLNFNTYEGKGQVKYNMQQVYRTSEPVDFSVDGFEPEASFNQEIIYDSQEYDSETNRTAVNTKIIYKDKNGIHTMPYMFFINHGKYTDDSKVQALKTLAENFDNLPFGSTIKVNGNINIFVEKAETEEDDGDSIPDFGGFQAKGQETYIKGSTIRELEITGADGKTLFKERYSEDDFAPKNDPFKTGSGSSGGSQSSPKDPFADDGLPIDISDDDLPF